MCARILCHRKSSVWRRKYFGSWQDTSGTRLRRDKLCHAIQVLSPFDPGSAWEFESESALDLDVSKYGVWIVTTNNKLRFNSHSDQQWNQLLSGGAQVKFSQIRPLDC